MSRYERLVGIPMIEIAHVMAEKRLPVRGPGQNSLELASHRQDGKRTSEWQLDRLGCVAARATNGRLDFRRRFASPNHRSGREWADCASETDPRSSPAGLPPRHRDRRSVHPSGCHSSSPAADRPRLAGGDDAAAYRGASLRNTDCRARPIRRFLFDSSVNRRSPFRRTRPSSARARSGVAPIATAIAPKC